MRIGRKRLRGPLGAVAALWLALATSPASGAVMDATGLCPPDADPCRVNTRIDVGDGALLDLGARTLEVLANGRLDVGVGIMTISAGAVRVRASGRLTGFGGRIVVRTSGALETEATSRIDVSGLAAGLISLEATGDVAIAGILDARSGGRADGGFVAVSGAAVTLATTARVFVGADSGAGGGVMLRAVGPLVVDAPLDAAGGASGGGIDCDAETVALNGRIDVSGGPGGSGAVIDLRAAGAVVVNGAIDGDARGSDVEGGGLGAELSISTQGPVDLNGKISLTGSGAGSEGGLIDIVAGGDVTQRSPIEARGAGADGVGGEVRLATDGGVTLGDIDVGGGGIANRVLVTSKGIVRLTGILAAEPGSGAGFGGVVEMTACALDMDSSAHVSTLGTEGRTALTTSGQMILRGTLEAGLENVLTTRDAASPPLVLGTITPPPTTRIDPLLPSCDVPGPGSTTTTTIPGECTDPALAPYDALLCRLSAIGLTIETASPASLGGKRTARSLRRRAVRMLAAVETARSGERVAKKLGVASVQLARLLARVQRRLDQGRFDPTIAARLLDLGTKAAAEIEALRFQTPTALKRT